MKRNRSIQLRPGLWLYRITLCTILLLLLSGNALASVPEDFPAVFGGGLLIEAHRGFSDQYPENSLAAFEAAAQITTFGAMETDIQLTADQVLVCMHDSTLDRTTDAEGSVSSYTCSELSGVRLDDGYGWSDEFAGKLTIPTLQAFLEICSTCGKVPFIELKDADRATADTLLTMLEEGGWQRRCVIISFSLEALEYVASRTDDYPLEYMPASMDGIDTLLRRVVAMKTGILRIDYRKLDDSVAAKCKDLGLAIETYTIGVGDNDTLQQVLSYGVIGVTCNSYRDFVLSDDLMHIDRDGGLPEPPEYSLSNCMITCGSAVWNEGTLLPTLTVKDRQRACELIPGIDYEAIPPTEPEAGINSLTLVGLGDYSGSMEVTYRILPAELSQADYAPLLPVTYNREAQCPRPELSLQGTMLQAGVDYSIAWEDNTEAGIGRVLLTGMGNYTGQLTLEFEIEPALLGAAEVSLKKTVYYSDGTPVIPELSVLFDDFPLVEGRDYTLSCAGNERPGTAAAVLTGIGNYTGMLSVDYEIHRTPLVYGLLFAVAAGLLALTAVCSYRKKQSGEKNEQ